MQFSNITLFCILVLGLIIICTSHLTLKQEIQKLFKKSQLIMSTYKSVSFAELHNFLCTRLSFHLGIGQVKILEQP